MFLNIDSEKGVTFSEKLSFEDSLRLLGTTALSLMQGLDTYVKENDPDNYEQVHGHIYDTFNILSGNILDTFDNTRCPATDLTAEAILRAENEILDEQVTDEEPIELEVTPTAETALSEDAENDSPA